MISTEVCIPGYKISDELYNGSRTLVYRGYRESDSLPVVIKLLKNAYPSFSELVQFRNQYTISKNLNYPTIIQTYSLETYHNGYALVMEDFGGISLKNYFDRVETLHVTSPLQEFLQVAISLCDILEILYQQRIIHKDIKPANILINPENKQVKLIDFSIASLINKETQEVKNPNVLEGTLAYLSPEQTGRMNRGIDYRSDFYSLGVTFYELLAGKLPFISDDAMELVHCHIAKQPPQLPHPNPLLHKERGQEIPLVLNDIVMKLMAKNAEDRYQSALGLKHDLETCLYQIKETGKIESFAIARQDICDRFLIPDKLYGRDKEVEQLLAAFDRVSDGNREMMLVAGFSGIGKTAVVNEVHKPIVKQRGYFIKGKFDQFNRNIPLSAFVQALRDLVAQLLCESQTELMQWKKKILAAVGENGQVIIDVIPQLEQIISKQPPAPELSGSAAQNRFNLLFQKLFEVFTTKEHPLVIFLDDLQWADSASLTLIKLLMNDNGYLMMLGAYRDNEVSPAHPFILTVEEVKKAEAIVNTITLAPLAFKDTNYLVADTLNCSTQLAQSLTELITRKTQGNPFFTTQFIKALYEEKHIIFNRNNCYWECDIAQINALSLTDDIVEFMGLQLQKLPESTQNILKLAACIGNQFDLETLAIVSEQSQTQTAADLWKALQEGLILPQSEVYKFYLESKTKCEELKYSPVVSYKFLHDRVQQAAYGLISDDQKQGTHLKIGRLLLQNLDQEKRDCHILKIVNQINQGINLVQELSERTELGSLNLIAAQKAQLSTAYNTAVQYCDRGIELLARECWQNQYNLSLSLYNTAAENAYLSGNFQVMEDNIAVVLQQSHTVLDRIKAYKVKIEANKAQNRRLEAVEIGLEVLEKLEIKFPKHPNLFNIGNSFIKTKLNLAGKQIADLVNLPFMVEPKKLAAMEIIGNLNSAIYFAKPKLFPLVIFKQVGLSLKYGNAPESTIAYGTYAVSLCGIFGDIEAGYQFGKLALTLLDHLGAEQYRVLILFIHNFLIRHWQDPLKETLDPLLESYKYGLETGDLEGAAFSLQCHCYYSYCAGKNLSVLKKEMVTYQEAIIALKQENPLHQHNLCLQVISNLQGDLENPYELDGDFYHQDTQLELHQKAQDTSTICILYIQKLILCYLFENSNQALRYAELVEQNLEAITARIDVVLFFFYSALAQLSLVSDAPHTQKKRFLKSVASARIKLKKWSRYAPKNHQHKYHLLKAEEYRVLGKTHKAIEFYDKAIAGAKENEYIQEEALANELAAKFYLDWGKEKVASGYMQEAYYCYAKWGAKAKTEDLEKRYPNLLKPILQQQRISFNPSETISFPATSSSTRTSNSISTSISDILDFTSILKAAQTISSNIELDQLITNLTTIILQNSGAKKSVLILPQENNWQVRAITFINHQNNSQPKIKTILDSQSIDSCQDIPIKIINYIKNTQETVVIDNSQTEIPGIIGQYMLEHEPKSVLCTPIIDRGNLVGILYLENKFTSRVFTKERLQVINLLSSQAAISLENARFYQQAQQALENLQQAQLQIVQSEKMSALGNLVAGVAHEMNNPLGFINVSLKQTKPICDDIIEHLKLYQEILPNPDEEIIEHAQYIDLDYSLGDLPQMLDSMVMACDRLKNISTSLRTFSRADKEYKVACNIHQGIDSTILILKHRLKINEQRPAIEVITDYADLPQIECFPGQLNQVFMNILANAIDALEDLNTGRTFEEIQANPNQITVKTLLANNSVKITITDNGKGMNEETKNKIFEHLFTTKGVGKGTGLGLAIAKQIIEEKHGGKLSCNSVLGEGTEFVIEIPV